MIAGVRGHSIERPIDRPTHSAIKKGKLIFVPLRLRGFA
jgi:hypothetical protein